MTNSESRDQQNPERLLRMAQGSARTSNATGFVPPSLESVAAWFPELTIDSLIGRGGMGAVYLARQPKLDRPVAIKILPPSLAQDPTFAERFAREARTLAKLSHRHIVKVFDFGERGGVPFLLLEYVEGSNLRELMQMGRPSPAEALRLIPQICDALAYAHAQGIVHRDVKPENILVDAQGDVHIADFGIARLLGDDPREVTLTGTRERVGTPHYMAPEQIENPASVDHRADIFGLGVVLYEMLTGKLPLGRFDPPSADADVSSRVDDIVFRSLEREPSRRYQAASELKSGVLSAWKEGFAAGVGQAATTGAGGVRTPPSGRGPESPRAEPAPEPVPSRLSKRAVGSFFWLLGSCLGLILLWMPVGVTVSSPGEAPPPPKLINQILMYTVMAFSLAGFVGGPFLASRAVRDIVNSRGRLYGLRLAVLTMWLPAIFILDAVLAGVIQSVSKPTTPAVRALSIIALLTLDIWILTSEVRKYRRQQAQA